MVDVRPKLVLVADASGLPTPASPHITSTPLRNTWFLAGDNRGESDDSRFWGPVPTDAIVGIVRFRHWPLGKAGTL
jgi:type IV secretory pathway protease TraF